MSGIVGPLVYDGNVPVTFIPADSETGYVIADIQSPTDAELDTDAGDGVALGSYIQATGGINFNRSTDMIDTSALDRENTSEYPGGLSGTPSITFRVQNRDGDKAAWELFKDGKVAGDFVFGYEGSNEESSDEVDVIRAVCSHPVRNNPARGDEQLFTVQLGVQDEAYAVEVESAA
jgi:hypothetical protein